MSTFAGKDVNLLWC